VDRRNKDFRKLVIRSMLICVAIMLVGVIVLARNYIGAKPGLWDIKIVDINEGVPTGGAKNKTAPFHTGTTMLFDVEFSAPGESMTYDVTVKNVGSLDAKVGYIAPYERGTNKYIKYTITGIEKGSEIGAGETLTFQVKVEYENTDELIYDDNPIYIELGFEQLA